VNEGEAGPGWFGVVSRDLYRRGTIVAPIPLNRIYRLASHAYWWLRAPRGEGQGFYGLRVEALEAVIQQQESDLELKTKIISAQRHMIADLTLENQHAISPANDHEPDRISNDDGTPQGEVPPPDDEPVSTGGLGAG